ncbi:hypothetical protein OH460_04610 [Vibrio sp. Makdt]|uniref:hypothetical protein n=1 Tax=Vibrio sp. Makdt TaxID=2998828 RepID=UPI0022CD7D8E|nr:hypothetical protein [Vibrio sp. Makdt]MDA0151582.1 hypothetical protein [Vibrio sp. Makdt]
MIIFILNYKIHSVSEIFLLSKVKLKGRVVSHGRRPTKALVTFIPVVELSSYVETSKPHQALQMLFSAAQNPINKKKTLTLQNDIKNEVISGELGVPLSLTVVVSGDSEVHENKMSTEIEFERTTAFVVGNLLTYNAILNLTGLKAPLFSSRVSASDLQRNSVFRQLLVTQELMLTIVFREKGFNEDEVRSLFFKHNRRGSEIHLTQFANKDSFPLQKIVSQLSENLTLDDLGGVSNQTKHVRASDKHITTEYILFKVLVGSVCGEKVQERAKMSDDIALKDDGRFVQTYSDTYQQYVETFFKAWLTPIRENHEHDRKGFRLSAQIWQALSLVINALVLEGKTLDQVSNAGAQLGKLDYGKRAKHWKNCDVMQLDSNGRLFKNGVRSTREFKLGLKDYFIKVLTSKNYR